MCCYRGMLSHVCSGRCASISYVLVWQGLCSFKTRRQRAVGGGQGALVLAAMFPWVMLTHLGTLQEGGGVRRGKEREMAKRCQRRGEQSRARWDELLPRAQPSLQAHFWVGLSDKSGTSAWFACRKGNWKGFVLVHLHDYGFKMTIAIMCHHCSLIFRDRLFFFIAPSRKQNTSLTSSRLSEPLHENAISPIHLNSVHVSKEKENIWKKIVVPKQHRIKVTMHCVHLYIQLHSWKLLCISSSLQTNNLVFHSIHYASMVDVNGRHRRNFVLNIRGVKISV